ncbi:hypothetical protein [Candidatus Methanocrinis natronophilus]|uniref:Uncharacterized protein n=1 Tax=Candidatus Methanocrinis natronophilus TaxID=3033396 RepID=A0ABT5X956_9EURY|nr:hypothetical protein [Candidatus Methanocrinis natronophilus]MDF0591240.1 hypothetical protein [Candidatus Methanocrinis natronophilus]
MKTAERFLHSAERNLEIEENEMAEIASRALWEAFFCVGAYLGIVVIFRERFNSGGRLARFMADNSFAVYFFHPVIQIPRHRRHAGGRPAPPRQVRRGSGGGGADMLCGERDGGEEDSTIEKSSIIDILCKGQQIGRRLMEVEIC